MKTNQSKRLFALLMIVGFIVLIILNSCATTRNSQTDKMGKRTYPNYKVMKHGGNK